MINVRNNRPLYDSLCNHINNNTNNHWLPKGLNTNNVNSNSWFDIIEQTPKRRNNKNKIFNINLGVENVRKMNKCEKINLYPTHIQKQIIDKWMEAYLKMYNSVIYLIRQNRYNKVQTTTSWMKLRTNFLKNLRNKIQTDSQLLDIKKNTKISIHMLDYAIQCACSSYKSCLTNYIRGNIRYFRLRYLKKTKKSFVIRFEKSSINKKKDGNSFCSRILGNNIKCGSKFKMSTIDSDFFVHYNAKTKKYTLLNPIKINQQEQINNQGNSVAIDPGIRTFATLFENNKCVHIGNNLKQKIQGYLNKIDNVSKKHHKKNCIKNKVIRTYYKKINNIVDDLHWKTIKYLTNNYDNILIGNLSTKSIVSNSKRQYKRTNNQLHKNTKRVAMLMSLYRFRQRLEYKCLFMKKGYALINEAYTSKTCTNCQFLHLNLGSNKVFKCPNRRCKMVLDRDINGARNILLKGIN